MTDKPAVTVVIPAYNIAQFIGPCLQSVIGQSLEDLEIIVIDDGSTDGTYEAVSRFADSRIRLIRQDNQGVSRARNLGIRLAAGESILLLDGDDLLHHRALERLYDALIRTPRAVAAYGTFLKILESGALQPQQRALRDYRFPSGDLLARLIEENILIVGQVLLRGVVAKNLRFDEDLRLSEDWKFWCHAAACGEFVFIGNEPHVACMRLRPGSSSRALGNSWNNFVPAIEAVRNCGELRQRFSAAEWKRLNRRAFASHLWEYGRVQFCGRRCRVGRRYMWRSIFVAFRWKRALMLISSYPSQLLDIPIAPRLRFNDFDIAASDVQRASD